MVLGPASQLGGRRLLVMAVVVLCAHGGPAAVALGREDALGVMAARPGLELGSVLIVFNSSPTSGTSNSTRSTYLILWVFSPDQPKFSCFRQRMTGHHQISWR